MVESIRHRTRAAGEGYFDQDDADWLRALFSLHAAVREVGWNFHVVTADDLTEAVLPAVPTSPFLTSLNHISYYGFYDLTQVQLSMFQAVSGTVPTTLFFLWRQILHSILLDASSTAMFSRCSNRMTTWLRLRILARPLRTSMWHCEAS